jgi:hypothetical protein
LDAADTDDYERFLIAYAWHLYDLSDPVYSLMQGARMMGRSITEEHAKDMIEAAGAINARRSADGLARWLGSRSGSANFLASGPSDQST